MVFANDLLGKTMFITYMEAGTLERYSGGYSRIQNDPIR